MTTAFHHRPLRALLGVLVLLVAVLFLQSPGTSDVWLFMRWMDNISRLGVVAGYQMNDTVQPPLYAVIFWVIAKSGEWLGTSPFIAYKVSLLLAWLLTGLCLRQWTASSASIWTTLLLLIPNSMALGYFDIYLAPLLLLALWAARTERWALFSASFALLALTKAQGLILAPFGAIFAAKVALGEREMRDTVRVIAMVAAPAGLIGLLVLAVFGAGMITAFQRAVEHDMFSGQALNLPWVITHYVRAARPELFGGLLPDGTAEWMRVPATHALRWWMRAIFYTVYGLILLIYARRGRSLQDFVFYSLLGFLAYFVLSTGVHENHLFYAAIISVVLFLIDRSYIYHAGICCLAANVNMILFYGLTGAGLPFSRVVGVDLAVVFAGVNVVFFLVALAPILGRRGLRVASPSGRVATRSSNG